MLIAFDIGNTNVLVGEIDDDGSILRQTRIETSKILVDKSNAQLQLLSLIKKLSIISDNTAIIASVVPQVLKIIVIMLESKSINFNIIKSTDTIIGMKVELDKPEELGADRIVNSFAAFNEYKTSLIVIDFGTATTFDIIDSIGVYKGGLICPGIKLSIKSLNIETAQLPLIELKRVSKIIGTSTKSAIESGIYWGYVSLVEGLISKIKIEMEIPDCIVVGTGGLSHIFKEDIKEINYFNDDLTLKGLYQINRKINDQK
jgi:type III pantothenate kinase|tara:strand:- start:2001 stop:2777 length:777 start_codon:yes stop_codon:yes gene_type:complete